MLLVTANIFQPLIDVFESVLKFFHDSGGISWGWSIVLLTIAVRAVLIPLTFRQIKSMVRMQGLAPQMKLIQQKYKQDKPRQQEEMMKFYKENNVNPLGSCLPMVLQLPVFISLYYMLRKNLLNDICPAVQTKFQHAYALAHHESFASAAGQTRACGSTSASHFLFIHDLTAKATGIELGILIVLYVGSQLSSSLLMSAASMDQTQRRIMMFMPLIFVLFVIRFPAGLLLYWITTNLWTVAQQYTVRRIIGPMQAATVPAGGGGEVPLIGDGAGNGGGSSSSGFGGRIRDRLAAAQSDAVAARQAKSSPGNGGGRTPPVATKTTAKNATKGANGAKGATTSKGANGNGAAPASKSAATGNGTSAGPPRPPRKKKKRSGRRR